MADPSKLSPKDRMNILRVPMPELEPDVRARCFQEVNLGLTTEGACEESARCLACNRPACMRSCPVGVQIREVVRLISEGDYLGAAKKMREDNSLPAITGRVCPQESQCEGGCIVGVKGQPVAIGNLERFIADYERESGHLGLPDHRAGNRQKRRHRRQRSRRALCRGRPHSEGPPRPRL